MIYIQHSNCVEVIDVITSETVRLVKININTRNYTKSNVIIILMVLDIIHYFFILDNFMKRVTWPVYIFQFDINHKLS